MINGTCENLVMISNHHSLQVQLLVQVIEGLSGMSEKCKAKKYHKKRLFYSNMFKKQNSHVKSLPMFSLSQDPPDIIIICKLKNKYIYN